MLRRSSASVRRKSINWPAAATRSASLAFSSRTWARNAPRSRRRTCRAPCCPSGRSASRAGRVPPARASAASRPTPFSVAAVNVGGLPCRPAASEAGQMTAAPSGSGRLPQRAQQQPDRLRRARRGQDARRRVRPASVHVRPASASASGRKGLRERRGHGPPRRWWRHRRASDRSGISASSNGRRASRRRPADGWHLGQRQQGRQAHLRVCIVEQLAARIAVGRLRRSAAAPAPRCGERRPTDGSSRASTAAVASACLPSSRPRPCSVHRAWIAPTFRPIASTDLSPARFDQRRHHVELARARPAAAGRAAARTCCRSSASRRASPASRPCQ